MAIITGYGQILGSWAYDSEFNMFNKWLEINQIQLGHIMEYLGGKNHGWGWPGLLIKNPLTFFFIRH